MLIVAPIFLRKSVNAMAIFPFILLKNLGQKKDLSLINHEKIHIQQQKELLVVFFFFWYAVEFLYRLIIHKNFHQAYLNISFEKEAYSNQNELNYLKNRKFLAFLQYSTKSKC